MYTPPVSANLTSAPLKNPNTTHQVETSNVSELANKMNIPSSTSDSIKTHTRKQTLPLDPPLHKTVLESLNTPWHKSGLLEKVPPEAIPLILRQMDDVRIYAMPTRTLNEINECMKLMKLFWKASPQTPANQIVLDKVDAKKFANWIDVNKISINSLPPCTVSEKELKNLFPLLEYVDLSGFSKFDPLPFCKNAKHLNLTEWNLTDESVDHIINLTELTSLNTPHCRSLTDARFERILTGLTKLNSLNILNCTKLTIVGFKHITKLKQLNAITLNSLYKLGKEGLECITDLTKLTSISINDNKLTDTDIEHIATKLPGLTHLKIADCYNLTDASIEHIATKLPGLKYLNVNDCKQLTDAALLHIETNLPALTHLNIGDCKLLTDQGIYNLTKTHPGLILSL